MGNDAYSPAISTPHTSSPEDVWDPGRAVMRLKAEQDANLDTTDIARTEEKLLKAAPLAAEALIHMMQYSSNERIRLAAAQSVLDRVLGKPDNGGLGGNAQDPIERLLSLIAVNSAATAVATTSQAAGHHQNDPRGQEITIISSDPTPVHGDHDGLALPSVTEGPVNLAEFLPDEEQ